LVRWSQRARADLKAIHDYIANGAPLNAKAVAREISQRAAQLFVTPRIGRRVPELNDAEIREVPVHSWRIIYQLRGDDVFIITLIHRRRLPTADDLRG
jgi:plasmid stabilization system protein ParE